MKFETYSNKLYYSQCDDSNVGNTYTDEEILNAFAFALRRMRANKNLSLVQLSKMTGIPHQTLSAYERNFRIPTILQALKIAGALGFTIEDFVLDGLEQRQPSIEEEMSAHKI